MSRDLHVGEDVLDAGGGRLGSVERLVVDPRAHRVTHVIVEQRLVPVDRLRDAGPDGLVADLSVDELDALPRADPSLLGEPGPQWRPPGGYALENFLAITEALVGGSPYVPPVSLPADPAVHEITEGSPVWAGDRRLGEVERVLTDDAGRVTALVVRRDGVLAGHGRLAAGHVTEVVGNNVHTDLAPDAELPDDRLD